MKSIVRLTVLLSFMLFSTTLWAQVSEKASALVKGNCEMCQTRIQNAAKRAGASTSSWRPTTQTLEVTWDPKKSSLEKILKKVADSGHDNEKFKAEDKTYKNLPACCLYDRNAPLGVMGAGVHTDEIATHNPSDDNHTHAPTANQNEITKIETPREEDASTANIETVTITKEQDPTALSKSSSSLVFNIGQKELLKAACCNLAESFETNATVDVSFSNAVSGTKQLKMLGLDQKYTALTKELLPEIRGIATAYGLNFIPGRWIGGIQLTKGGSTVTGGYESITGQINTELVRYKDKDETALNLFVDQNLRTELNLTTVNKLNDSWDQSILLHANATLGKSDHNEDGFLDQPTGRQLNATYLLHYDRLQETGWGSNFGINLLNDVRYGGQMDYNRHLSANEQSAYGLGIDISRFQIWNKTGHIFNGKPYQSIGLQNQYTYHEQDSFFGRRNYLGKQHTFYSSLIFESILGNTNHKYKTGASFLYDRYDETYLNDRYERTESVPGLFFEYTLTGLKYSLVAGSRVDFHNLAGTQFTPRFNFRYNFTPKTTLRLSLGRGFRTANLFAESQGFLASNREIEILSNGGNIYGLQPETAWNYGASLNQEFKLFGRSASLLVDYFRTDFQNQVLLDLDESAQKIVFYNLEGKSFAGSLQSQLDFSPLRNFDVRFAYKYYDVQADYLSGRREAPFMAKHRGFLNLAYETTKTDKGGFWSFDTTLNYVGKQKLPLMNGNPSEFTLPDYSDPYFTLNAQLAKNLNQKTRIYLGAENLTSLTQDTPIIDAKNPFSNYFDGGMIYAPLMPVNFYLGVDLAF